MIIENDFDEACNDFSNAVCAGCEGYVPAEFTYLAYIDGLTVQQAIDSWHNSDDNLSLT